MEATITLEYADAKMAKAVAAAVSPDNLKTPKGLGVKTTLENSSVITRIQCDGKLSTFTATIDDLLFCAQTAEKTLQSMNKTNH